MLEAAIPNGFGRDRRRETVQVTASRSRPAWQTPPGSPERNHMAIDIHQMTPRVERLATRWEAYLRLRSESQLQRVRDELCELMSELSDDEGELRAFLHEVAEGAAQDDGERIVDEGRWQYFFDLEVAILRELGLRKKTAENLVQELRDIALGAPDLELDIDAAVAAIYAVQDAACSGVAQERRAKGGLLIGGSFLLGGGNLLLIGTAFLAPVGFASEGLAVAGIAAGAHLASAELADG